MESFVQILIYVHACLGFIALLSGAIAMAVKKGGALHKKMGIVFYYGMFTSIVLAILVAVLPGHENSFLLSIGLFSAYFLMVGKRSLHYNKSGHNFKLDRLLAYSILVTGILMILYSIILNSKTNVVLLVFGLMAIAAAFRDLNLLRNIEKMRKGWLRMHIGNMVGAYIAATTAFFVVSDILPGLFNWFVPSILGSVYITFWMIKIKKKATL